MYACCMMDTGCDAMSTLLYSQSVDVYDVGIDHDNDVYEWLSPVHLGGWGEALLQESYQHLKA